MAINKKRLTDVVREEMQKSPENEVAIVAEEIAEAHEDKGAKAKAANSTKADLEATVTKLKDELAQGNQREEALKQQVSDLQADLQAHKTYVEKLKEYLEQAEKLKTELDAVKQDNLRLAEANIQLTEKMNTPQERYSQKGHKLVERAAPIVAAKSTEQTSVQPSNPQEDNSDKYRISKLLRRPVGSNASLSQITDKNIGWVD